MPGGRFYLQLVGGGPGGSGAGGGNEPNLQHNLHLPRRLRPSQGYKNTFFNLYCINEFTRDTYASNRIRHFELILLQNGFALSQEGTKSKLNASSMMEEINDQIFEDYLEEPKDEQNWHTSPKYNQLLKNIHYLHLPPCENETLEHFKEIVSNRRRVDDHDALMRFLKSDEVINDELADINLARLETKAVTNTYQMIKIVRVAGAKWGFGFLEEAAGEFAKLDEGLYKLVKRVFKLTRANPQNQQEAGKNVRSHGTQSNLPQLPKIPQGRFGLEHGRRETTPRTQQG